MYSINGISRVTCLLTYAGTFLLTCTWALRKPGAELRPPEPPSSPTGTFQHPSHVLQKTLCNCSCVLRMVGFVDDTSRHAVCSGNRRVQCCVSKQPGAHGPEAASGQRSVSNLNNYSAPLASLKRAELRRGFPMPSSQGRAISQSPI